MEEVVTQLYHDFGLTKEAARRDYNKILNSEFQNLSLSLVGSKLVNWATLSERLKASRRGVASPLSQLTTPTSRMYLEQMAAYHNQKIHSILGRYGGLVSSFRPATAKYLVTHFKATRVCDPCSGWGGRLVGSVSAGASYIGIDTNHDLKEGYDKLTEVTGGNVTMIWRPAESVAFSSLSYDMVMTSPPFDDVELYQHQPKYEDWTHQFLLPVFLSAYSHLDNGGVMCLALPHKLYRVMASSELGECHEQIEAPIRCRKKGGKKLGEIIYVWHKP